MRLSEGRTTPEAVIAFQTAVDGLLADARLALDAIVAHERQRHRAAARGRSGQSILAGDLP